MNVGRLPVFILIASIQLLARSDSAGQSGAVLVLENIGLKNTYRAVFLEWDVENNHVSGSIEILGDEDGRVVPHTRIPFFGTVEAKEDGVETIQASSASLVSFYPPAEGDSPYPKVEWTLTGREAGAPALQADFWMFESESRAWKLLEMTFDVVAEALMSEDPLGAEAIGGIGLGMTEQQLSSLVETRWVKGNEYEEGATGLWVQEWRSESAGLTLQMASERSGQPKFVTAITAESNCSLKTARDIGIGSTRSEVEAAYADAYNAEDSALSEGRSFVAGSIYGGIIFHLEEDRVEEIFLGAAAE